jgi:hypothetical protein
MLLPVEIQQARMAVCESCPELTNLTRCKKCGCFMTFKVKIQNAKCPLGKWPKLEEWTTNNLNKNLVK